jgi:hypothetical protein
MIGTIQNGWFQTYNGRIYGNKPTDIHNKINNKAIIASSYVKPATYGEDYRKALEEARPRREKK